MATLSAEMNSEALSRLSGEFIDPTTERVFRRDQATEAFNQARIVFALGAIVSAILLAAGLTFGNVSPSDVLPARGAAIAASLICLLLAWKIEAALLPPVVAAWQATIILTSSALIPLNPDTALVSVFLIPALLYLAVPNNFRMTLILGLAASTAFFAAYYSTINDPMEALRIASILATVNLMLAVLKSRSERNLRRQWSITRQFGQALIDLDENRALIERTFDAVPVPLLVTAVDTGLIERANDAAMDFLGGAGDTIIGRQASEFHESPALREAFASQLRKTGHVRDFRAKLLTQDRQSKTVLLSSRRIDSAPAQKMVACIYDVTEREENERRLNLAENEYRALFENAEVGIYRSTVEGKMVRANPALAQLNGYDNPESLLDAVGNIDNEWYVEPGRRQVWLKLMREKGRVTDFVSEVYRHKTRERIWVSENAWTFFDHNGEASYFEGTVVEATDRKHAEAEIAHLASHDPLTDLPNRRLFTERLEEVCRASTQNGSAFTVFCLDLDRFKAVNDAFGHSNGDLLLIEAARRLRLACRMSDTVARLGGDEFMILAPRLSDPREIVTIASRILDAFDMPFHLDGHRAVVGISIGISMAPNDGAEPQALLKLADQALYQAKDAGKKTFRFFNMDMNMHWTDREDRAARASERRIS